MTLQKNLAALIMTLACVIAPQFVSAQDAQEAPDALVQRISLDVINSAKADKSIQAGDKARVHALVEEKILPHVDFEKMTSGAAGRDWSKGTPEQQAQLTKEFRNLLVYTYAGAITQIRDQKVVFTPMHIQPGDTDAEVHSEVKQPHGEAIQLGYRLEKLPDGWKIYDMNIMGAWLVETYKSSFTTEISKGGFDGLIKTLSDKNKALAARK